MKSKFCVGKIWPGHMQRLDASCTLVELWRRDRKKPHSWKRDVGCGKTGWKGDSQQGETHSKTAPLSAATLHLIVRPVETDRCFKGHHRTPGL